MEYMKQLRLTEANQITNAYGSSKEWWNHKCICFVWQTIEHTSAIKLNEDHSHDKHKSRLQGEKHKEYSKA